MEAGIKRRKQTALDTSALAEIKLEKKRVKLEIKRALR
jgi:hypothetical protein